MTTPDPLTARLAAIPAIAGPYNDAPIDTMLFVVTDDAIIAVDTISHLAAHPIPADEICHSLRILIAATGWLPGHDNPAMYQMRALACYTLHGTHRCIVANTADRTAAIIERTGDQPLANDPTTYSQHELTRALGDLAVAWHEVADRYRPRRPHAPYDEPEIANLAAMIAHGASADLPADVWTRCGLNAVRMHAARISASMRRNQLIGRAMQVRDAVRDDVDSGELDFSYANQLLAKIGLPNLERVYQVSVDVPAQAEVSATDPDDAEQKALDLLEGSTRNGDADWDWASHQVRQVIPGRVSFDDTDLAVTW